MIWDKNRIYCLFEVHSIYHPSNKILNNTIIIHSVLIIKLVLNARNQNHQRFYYTVFIQISVIFLEWLLAGNFRGCSQDCVCSGNGNYCGTAATGDITILEDVKLVLIP